MSVRVKIIEPVLKYLRGSGGTQIPVVGLPQSVSPGNTKTITAADAQPGVPWVGSWEPTRDVGVVRQLAVLASTNAAVGGTFTFEYGEDGVTALISEARVISTFTTVRDFDLINAGAYFRVKFEPAAPLAGDLVFVTTTFRTQNDGSFVRLAGQEIEEANAAMGQTFAYLKGFNSTTGLSKNVRVNSTGNLLTADFLTEVGKGQITGHSLVNKFGRNTSVAAGVEEMLWFTSAAFGGWLTAAAAVRVRAGGNAADTAAGAGARSVTIEGLDQNWALASETIATAGAAASGYTTTTFIRVFRAYVATAGTYATPYNTGAIVLETAAGVVMAGIEATTSQTQMAVYAVPASKTGYLLQASATVEGGKSADVFVKQRQNADVTVAPVSPARLAYVFTAVTGQASAPFPAPLGPFPAKTDLWMSAIGAAGGSAVGGTFSLLLVDN